MFFPTRKGTLLYEVDLLPSPKNERLMLNHEAVPVETVCRNLRVTGNCQTL